VRIDVDIEGNPAYTRLPDCAEPDVCFHADSAIRATP